MTHRIRFTLIAVLLIGASTLVLGGLGAVKSTPRGHSPYLSAMSDLAVPPAAAVPCNHMVCVFVDHGGTHHDHWECTANEFSSHCLLQNNNQSCTNIDPCPPL